MENKVYYSPKEVFEARAQEVAKAKETGGPIFTPESYGVHIMVDYDMQQKLTRDGLVHKSVFEEDVGLHDEASPIEFHATYNSIYRKLAESNKDAMFVFLATADPERLADEEIQTTLLTRLAEVQKEDMVKAIVEHKDPTEVAETNANEISSITTYLGTMKDAVQVEGSYYAAGFIPDDAQ